MCVCVCALGWVNAEHQFRHWEFTVKHTKTFFIIFYGVEIHKALAGTDFMSAYLLNKIKKILVTNVHLWDESLLV